MSAPPKFATLPEAIAAYRAGRSRRWAEVDGWQIDLEQAAAEEGRVREEPDGLPPPTLLSQWGAVDRELHGRIIEQNIAAELARASEVLPELAVPSGAATVERCPWCGHVEEVAR